MVLLRHCCVCGLKPPLDIFDVGVLATTSFTVIFILTFSYILPLLLPPSSPSPFVSRLRTLSTKTLRIQAYSLLFCCIVLVAAMIPFMLFFATREAVLRAFVGTLELRRRWLRRFRLLVGVRLCIASLITVCLFSPSLFPSTFTDVRTHSRTSSHLSMVLTLLHLYRGGCLAQSRQGGARCCHC